MADIERMTITLPAEMAITVKNAVAEGDYASEVIREAVRDWKLKRNLQIQELEALKADIATGLADVAEGRVHKFDKDDIVARGRQLLARRSYLAAEASEAVASGFIEALEAALETARHFPNSAPALAIPAQNCRRHSPYRRLQNPILSPKAKKHLLQSSAAFPPALNCKKSFCFFFFRKRKPSLTLTTPTAPPKPPSPGGQIRPDRSALRLPAPARGRAACARRRPGRRRLRRGWPGRR